MTDDEQAFIQELRRVAEHLDGPLSRADGHLAQVGLLVAELRNPSDEYDDRRAPLLIAQAIKGDLAAAAALRQAAGELLLNAKQLPPNLAEYIGAQLVKDSLVASNKRRLHAKVPRNHVIVRLVRYACRSLHLLPTRNDGSREAERANKPAEESGCSIVAKAVGATFGMGERAIEKIWERRAR